VKNTQVSFRQEIREKGNMMASTFAVVSKDLPIIWGRRLHPLGTGQFLLLVVLRNHFLIGGELTEEDVIQGTWVCSQPFSDCVRTLYENQFVQDCQQWGRKIGFPEDAEARGFTFQCYLDGWLPSLRRWLLDEVPTESRLPILGAIIQALKTEAEKDGREFDLEKAWDGQEIGIVASIMGTACLQPARNSDRLLDNMLQEIMNSERDKLIDLQMRKERQ
jgi:hypothetical protein